MNKYRLKIIMRLLTIVISVGIFQGCSKDKTIVLNNDVRTDKLEAVGSSIIVEEKIIDLKLDNIVKGSNTYFYPSFWNKDEVIGIVKGQGNLIDYPVDGYAKKHFYSLNENGGIRETSKSVYEYNQRSIKEVLWRNTRQDLGIVYYYDYTKNNDYEKLILGKDLFDLSPAQKDIDCELVEGNDNYLVGWSNDKTVVNLLDIKNNKLYKSGNLENLQIKRVVYIKALESFMAISKNGQCYKIKLKDDVIKLEKYSKIDLGDLEAIDYKWQITLMDESQIAISNGVKKSKSILIRYDFKNNEASSLFSTTINEQIFVDKYYPRQDIIILSKREDIIPRRFIDGSTEGSYYQVTSSIKALYLARVVDNKLEIFNEIQTELKTDELFDRLDCSINEKGDKIFISKRIVNIKDDIYTSKNLYSIYNLIKK